MDRAMMKYQCKTCLGEYYDVGKDNIAYYHACPPIRISENEFQERPDKRDENAGRKLEGKGKREISI